jgi:hypothetical protein
MQNTHSLKPITINRITIIAVIGNLSFNHHFGKLCVLQTILSRSKTNKNPIASEKADIGSVKEKKAQMLGTTEKTKPFQDNFGCIHSVRNKHPPRNDNIIPA